MKNKRGLIFGILMIIVLLLLYLFVNNNDNNTVINYLQKAYPGYQDSIKMSDFFIGFDKNKNAYFDR